MKSKDYKELLVNEYSKKELTVDDFKNTLDHFIDININELKNELEALHTEYFNKYTNNPKANSDYFLFLGKCAGIDEALNILEETKTDQP